MLFSYLEDKIKSKEFNSEIKKQAADSFLKLGVPTIKHEEWKYSNLKVVANSQFEQVENSQINIDFDSELLKFGSNKIVFINGIFSSEHSIILTNSSFVFVTLSDSDKANENILEKYLGKISNVSNEAFTALNVALAEQGAFIYIPKNVTVSEPIIIQNIVDNTASSHVVNLHHLIVAEENAEAKIVEIFYSEGKEVSFENTLTEIAVNADARLDYYKIQNQNPGIYHVGTTQVLQEQKSYFYAATFSLDGSFIRNNLNIVLNGEYIENHMYGLYIPNGTQHIDNHTLVDHKMPNSESNELYKGILGDKSTGVFNGKIFVRQDAQKTNAYQNCRNVLISPNATMNTKPQLEIWADDVKCSHGTTTGQLNDDHIFYMQSRGIPKSEAVKLQLVAFAEDVVSQLKLNELKTVLEHIIEKKLNWTEGEY